MKKVLLAVVAVGFIFGMTSCDKKCTCKWYSNGKVTATQTYTIDKDSDKKCSDYATTAISDTGNGKTGIECK
ncbi:MAG: hypothetical protein J5642_06180 [Bacteroidales bacterium]|nr:hypothetical protein [Bacteroidales bacterium]